MSNKKQGYKNFIKFLAGMFTLILGITFALSWWPDFVSFLKGVSGIVFAMAGLVTLYSLKL